jgi:hypothetical protein
MAVLKKIAGLAAGVSVVAIVGVAVAVAQGVPPNPFISNPALGAGQQSTHLTSMGETGVPGLIDQVQTAQVTTIQETARVEQAPVVAQAAPPEPAPAQEQQQMGAAPAPVEQPAAAPMPRKVDRN